MNEHSPETRISPEESTELTDSNLEGDLKSKTAAIRCYHVSGITVENGVATVSLRGKILDEASIQQLGEILFTIANHSGVRGMNLDFKSVDYNSSAALGKYLTTDKILTTRGQPALAMSAMQPAIYEVMKITPVQRTF